MELCRCLNQLTAQGCRTANCSFSHSQQDPFSYSGSSDSGREKRGRKSKRPKRDWEQEDLPAQKRARHSSGDVWGRLGNYDCIGQDRRSVVWNSAGREEPNYEDWNEKHRDRINTGYSGYSGKDDSSHSRKNENSQNRKNDTSQSRKNDTGYSDSGTWDTTRSWSRDRSLQLAEESYSEALQEFRLNQTQNLLVKKDKEIERLKKENMTLLNQQNGSAEKKFGEVKKKLVFVQRETNEFKIKEEFSDFSLKYAKNINDAEKLELS